MKRQEMASKSFKMTTKMTSKDVQNVIKMTIKFQMTIIMTPKNSLVTYRDDGGKEELTLTDVHCAFNEAVVELERDRPRAKRLRERLRHLALERIQLVNFAQRLRDHRGLYKCVRGN
mgnify:CR=1 FL=1